MQFQDHRADDFHTTELLEIGAEVDVGGIIFRIEGGLPVAGGVIGAGGEIAWPRPTRPGDVLRVVSTVEKVTPSRSRPERGMLTCRSETLNQRGEVVQVLVSKLVAHRRPKAEAPGG